MFVNGLKTTRYDAPFHVEYQIMSKEKAYLVVQREITGIWRMTELIFKTAKLFAIQFPKKLRNSKALSGYQ